MDISNCLFVSFFSVSSVGSAFIFCTLRVIQGAIMLWSKFLITVLMTAYNTMSPYFWGVSMVIPRIINSGLGPNR